jgi:hypothetical protein
MTWAIFSIVANEVSPSGCPAYTYHQYSFNPYMRAPFFQFSEQLIDDWHLNGGTHPAYPFLTGNGGANQVVLFGYLGLRLLPDFVLHVDPNLPPQIPHVVYRTFYWRGWPIKAQSNYTHTTISRAPNTPPLGSADPKFRKAEIPVHVGPDKNPTVYALPISEPLIIPNRQTGSINTQSGNMVQCRAVSSPDEFQPGQFPIGAVDGLASTKWQPMHASSTASLTVSFPDSSVGAMIGGFAFDWAQSPPVSVKVLLHDIPLPSTTDLDISSSTAPPGTNVVCDLKLVAISDPYCPEVANIVLAYKGNTTNVTLASPVPATKYATLLIRGNQALSKAEVKAGNGHGASVAEWSILGADVGADGKRGRTKWDMLVKQAQFRLREGYEIIRQPIEYLYRRLYEYIE